MGNVYQSYMVGWPGSWNDTEMSWKNQFARIYPMANEWHENGLQIAKDWQSLFNEWLTKRYSNSLRVAIEQQTTVNQMISSKNKSNDIQTTNELLLNVILTIWCHIKNHWLATKCPLNGNWIIVKGQSNDNQMKTK